MAFIVVLSASFVPVPFSRPQQATIRPRQATILHELALQHKLDSQPSWRRSSPTIMSGERYTSRQLNRQAFNRRNMSVDERRAYDEVMKQQEANKKVAALTTLIALLAGVAWCMSAQ